MNRPMNQEQLTAYVLGELRPDEVEAVEQALAADPEARRRVEELRQTVAWTQGVYQAEPSLELTAMQRKGVEDKASATGGEARVTDLGVWRRYRRAVGIGIAAAAVILVATAVCVVPGPRAKLVRLAGLLTPVEKEARFEESALRHADSAKELQNAAPVPTASAPPAPAPAPAPGASERPPFPVDAFVEQRTRLSLGGRYEDSRKEDLSRQGTGASPSVSGGLKNEEAKHDVEVYQSYIGPQAAPAAPSVNPYNDPRQNYWPGHNTESYQPVQENPFRTVASEPLSTFSIDVDTASYSNVRRFLTQGTLPPPDSVRVEELINYFDYDYKPPTDRSTPFAAQITVAGCPWAPEHRLARIGIRGWEMPRGERPASNLVFLVDTSGSMQPENKLPLVRQALRLLVEALDERDRIAIVVYASASGLVLPSTPGNEKSTILSAIDRLSSGGSTHGSAGIQQAYDVAMQSFLPGGTNRVILATDGDFNVGVTNEGDLQRMIEEKAKSQVFLTVLGFGMGNLKDSMMETLADKGNGNYAYIDSFNEARKVLVEQLSGTLVTIAKDVKIQVEFNPGKVAGYRLLGYENRMLAKEDFNDDKKDAGEIGAGHRVTALYEIVPVGVSVDTSKVDALKYQGEQATPPASNPSAELLTVKMRYKLPAGDTSTKLEFPVTDSGMTYAQADPDFKFAASVAGFGMLLRHSPRVGNLNWSAVLELAQEGRGRDASGYRAEFLNLAQRAREMMGNAPRPVEPVPQPAPVDSLRYAPAPTAPVQPSPSQPIQPSANRYLGPRGPFMAPKGVVNLARGKAVTASDGEPILGWLSMITDGDKEGSEGSLVEFANGLQWVQIDLGAASSIYAIVMWHFHSQSRIYRDVIVQVSDDPSFATATTLYNNDLDDSAHLGMGRDGEYIESNEGLLIDSKGVRGRYVRCYSNGNSSNDMNHMTEVEVYGFAGR